jgi:hypothetical protein
MNFSKFLFIASLFFYTLPAHAEDFYKITQRGIKKYGYNKPFYSNLIREGIAADQYNLYFIADPDSFPFYSNEQGSVFYKVFSDLMNKEHIAIRIRETGKDYNTVVNEFEKILSEEGKKISGIDAIFGVEFDNVQYSTNKFLYPSFAENKIHLITPNDKIIKISSKNELKNYKGLYVAQDKVSKTIEKDFIRHGITKAETYDQAFEELLTGKVDFIVSSFYKSQIFLYQKGLRNFVNYSVNPVWKMPLFIKFAPRAITHQRIGDLKKYISSQEYKDKRDEALNEVLEFYKENTKGVIPPTYVKNMQTQI